jgi:hypothetical protein
MSTSTTTKKTDAPQADAEKPKLPHERDESSGKGSTSTQGKGAAGENQQRVGKQAHDDIKSGQVDTDMHGKAGLDAEQRDALTKKP